MSAIGQRIERFKVERHQLPELSRDALVTGYPVPQLVDGVVRLAVPMFFRRGFPPAPPQVSAPRWVVELPMNDAPITVRALEVDVSASLGPHVIAPRLDLKQFAVAEAELFEAMDVLLPTLTRDEVPTALRPAADDFARLWRQLSHRPLAEHYRALNPTWFSRLGL